MNIAVMRKHFSCDRRSLVPPRGTGIWHAIRRGTATAELAIGLVPLVVIFVGTIDTCQLMFLKEDATTIAFECARLGARPSITADDITNRANAMFNERGIKHGSVAVDIVSGGDDYDECNITIVIPEDNNLTFDALNLNRKVTVKRTTTREQFNYE